MTQKKSENGEPMPANPPTPELSEAERNALQRQTLEDLAAQLSNVTDADDAETYSEVLSLKDFDAGPKETPSNDNLLEDLK